MGIGMARFERHVYDPKLGLPANVGLYQAKPPSLLDVPTDMKAAAAAVICAISDALGGVYFNRSPVSTDMIVNALFKRPPAHKPLQVNSV